MIKGVSENLTSVKANDKGLNYLSQLEIVVSNNPVREIKSNLGKYLVKAIFLCLKKSMIPLCHYHF